MLTFSLIISYTTDPPERPTEPMEKSPLLTERDDSKARVREYTERFRSIPRIAKAVAAARAAENARMACNQAIRNRNQGWATNLLKNESFLMAIRAK